jgi:hypothetical protein
MTKTVVERIQKRPPDFDIDFIVGVDDNPDLANNAMFYVRMESITKKSGEYHKPREIYFSNEEMKKLSVLMTFASKFWEKNTLEKNTVRTKKKIKKFKKTWKLKKASLDLD